MDTQDYNNLVDQGFASLKRLHEQRESIDAEIAKQEQFITAASNFQNDKLRENTLERLRTLKELESLREAGLTDAVKIVLKGANDWLTTAEVRDRMNSSGFDFSKYTANPLASVSTTLRRMKSEEVVTRDIGGVAAYRWRRIGHVPARRVTLGEPPKTPTFNAPPVPNGIQPLNAPPLPSEQPKLQRIGIRKLGEKD